MVARNTPAALALVGATFAVPVHAESPVLKPAGNWQVDYGDETCRLNREFGVDGNKHLLTLRQYWPSREASLSVAGSGLRRFGHRTRTTLRFSPGQPPVEGRPLAGKVEAYGATVIFSAIDITKGEPTFKPSGDDEEAHAMRQLDVSHAAGVRFIELQQGARTIRLETGSLAEAFKVMNDCTASLVKAWGLDPERLRTAQSGPRWLNQESLVRKIAATYPIGALLAGEQGIMRMRVIVSTDGLVEGCTIIKATNTRLLESSACTVMKAARFEPARDAAGQPMRSFYATAITYVIGA